MRLYHRARPACCWCWRLPNVTLIGLISEPFAVTFAKHAQVERGGSASSMPCLREAQGGSAFGVTRECDPCGGDRDHGATFPSAARLGAWADSPLPKPKRKDAEIGKDAPGPAAVVNLPAWCAWSAAHRRKTHSTAPRPWRQPGKHALVAVVHGCSSAASLVEQQRADSALDPPHFDRLDKQTVLRRGVHQHEPQGFK